MIVVLFLCCLARGGHALPVPLTDQLDGTSSLPCSDLGHCRSVLDIIWSCLGTIFACTWVAIHPNIPTPSHGSISRRAKTFVFALIAPELIVLWAFRQWMASRRLARKYKEFGWTKTHGFFAIMGGFAIYYDNQSWSTVNPGALEPYLRNREIDITQGEIEDKSKGDALAKALVLLQVTWFILQFLARVVAHLPITELEVVTMAFAILNLMVYFCWWNKPLNVQYPIRVRSSIVLYDPSSKWTTSGRSGIRRFFDRVQAPQSHNTSQISFVSQSTEQELVEVGSFAPSNTSASSLPVETKRGVTGSDSRCDQLSIQEIRRSCSVEYHRDSTGVLSLRESSSSSSFSPARSQPVANFYISKQSNSSSFLHHPFEGPVRKGPDKFGRSWCIEAYFRTLGTLWLGIKSIPSFLAKVLGKVIVERAFTELLFISGDVREGSFHQVGAQSQYYYGYLDSGERFVTYFVASIIATLFGAIHCAAWSFPFPSDVEAGLWRTSSIAMTFLPIYGFILVRYCWSYLDSRAFSFVYWPPMLLYISARLLLLAQMFVLLRASDPGVYRAVHWTTFIPHI